MRERGERRVGRGGRGGEGGERREGRVLQSMLEGRDESCLVNGAGGRMGGEKVMREMKAVNDPRCG